MKVFANFKKTISDCEELEREDSAEVRAQAGFSQRVIHEKIGKVKILGLLYTKDISHVLAKQVSLCLDG